MLISKVEIFLFPLELHWFFNIYEDDTPSSVCDKRSFEVIKIFEFYGRASGT